jgi:hypothetical protein
MRERRSGGVAAQPGKARCGGRHGSFDVFARGQPDAADHLAARRIVDVLTAPGRAGGDLAVDVLQHFVHS